MERSIGSEQLKFVLQSLDQAAKKAGLKKPKIILCDGLAAIAYGLEERATFDIDAEIDTDIKTIERIKKNLPYPAEFSSDISRWEMIDIPEGYRDRAVPLENVKTEKIKVFLLSPLDLIISKLRVFRDKDIQDAIFLVKKFEIKKSELRKVSEQAIQQSPPSTEILRFRRSLQHFLKLVYRE